MTCAHALAAIGAGLWLTGIAAEQAAGTRSRVVGSVSTYTTERGDSLRRIGSRFGIEPRVIAAENGRPLAAPLPAGVPLSLDTRHLLPADVPDATIVINVPQRMLFYRTGDQVLAMPIAVGSPGWRTPLGPFTIVEKERDPTWDVPASIAREAAAKGKPLPPKIGPGPQNPLGRHWLRTSLGEVGIHGTNAPTSLYQAVTHGCIRAHPDDIAQLFDLVGVGTPGRFVYEPLLIVRDGADVLLEVHRDVYGRLRADPLEVVREVARAAALEEDIDWPRARTVVSARDGVPRVVTALPPNDGEKSSRRPGSAGG